MAMYMKDKDGNVQQVGFVQTQTVNKAEWKLLAETEITQEMIDEAGEEGITAIVLEFDPIEKWYGETWIRVEFGATKDLNTANDGALCGFGKTLENSTNASAVKIIHAQTPANAPLWNGYSNAINLFTNWYNNNARGTIYMNNAYNAYSYPTTAYATSNVYSQNIIGCKYLWFGGASKKFKFPAGTKLKLFGRFEE